MAQNDTQAFANTLQTFKTASGKEGKFYSLPELSKEFPGIERMPRSLRIVLESVLRRANRGGKTVTDEHVRQLAGWQAEGDRTQEVPFTVGRVLLQDFTGVPLLVDLAAMRSAADRAQVDANSVQPVVPVDLVVDHSVMVDYYRRQNALALNTSREYERNQERYKFLKWSRQAFDNLSIVPPGFGICHQVNLEYLGRGTLNKDGVYYPDSLVGTDSHTPMVNGIGTLGWGVGGIEAEAAMLGEPVYILTPDVVGVEFKGKLREGCTATDLVLTVTELLRKHKVVGKFVEYFGDGVATLTVPDRATLANMSPEYGATCGYWPVDERTVEYFRGTGRTDEEIEIFEAYYKAQGMFGTVPSGSVDYSEVITLDLDSVQPSIAGPKRPQDRIALDNAAKRFRELFTQSMDKPEGGFNLPIEQINHRVKVTLSDIPGVFSELPEKPLPDGAALNKAEMVDNKPDLEPVQHHADEIDCGDENECTLGHGDIVIAAITSCTNTSNPSVMLGAGLLCKKAVELGLNVHPRVKTSLAPGSRVVTEYLTKTGLLPYMEKVGFGLVAYGCTTCIGNSGDLTEEFNEIIQKENLVCASVLSGNRNFEARIHPNVKANFLMSPPLVVAYAIAGSMLTDVTTEPLGQGKDGKDVYLKDIWPTSDEINGLIEAALDPVEYRSNYKRIQSDPGQMWKDINAGTGKVYDWPESTYIAEPPFFDGFTLKAAPEETKGTSYALKDARIMALFGDSLTTDHISPAGRIEVDGPSGKWLLDKGVKRYQFNSYGSRRGNHEVMMRGSFANVRIKNLMIPPTEDGSRIEGGYTLYQPDGVKMDIYDAAMKYIDAGVDTVIFAGEEYGTGSSRDWAAKGTLLLGIKTVIARSYERIHRSNLIGMGIMPLQLQGDDSWESLGIKGDELIDVIPPAKLSPKADVKVVITRQDGSHQEITATLRLDTATEVDYFTAGGILPYVLRELAA